MIALCCTFSVMDHKGKLTKGKTVTEGECGLMAMVRESMYLAWPLASTDEDLLDEEYDPEDEDG